MDSGLPTDEISEEVARQLLIQISQSVPGEESSSEKFPSYNDSLSNGVDPSNGQNAEEYRLKLISISYTKSSDLMNTPSQSDDPSV